jgi:hypothetical protein
MIELLHLLTSSKVDASSELIFSTSVWKAIALHVSNEGLLFMRVDRCARRECGIQSPRNFLTDDRPLNGITFWIDTKRFNPLPGLSRGELMVRRPTFLSLTEFHVTERKVSPDIPPMTIFFIISAWWFVPNWLSLMTIRFSASLWQNISDRDCSLAKIRDFTD